MNQLLFCPPRQMIWNKGLGEGGSMVEGQNLSVSFVILERVDPKFEEVRGKIKEHW